jgi:hypothetical protein
MIGARECPCDNVPGVEAIRGVLGRAAYVPDRVPRMTSTTMSASLSLLTAGVIG